MQLQHDSQHPLALNKHDTKSNAVEVKMTRRRSRGRRRSSSEFTFTEDDPQPNKPHRRRSSHGTRPKPEENKKKDSPAFQSIVDIISEIKRLPTGSIYQSSDSKRIRRHSEPPQLTLEGAQQGLTTIQEQTLSKDMASLSLEPQEDTIIKRNRSQSVPSTTLSFHSENSNRRLLYTPHMKTSEATAAVRSRQLYSGILRVSSQDSSEADVDCEQLDSSIYIFGSRNRNRALDGDQVVVELVDVDEMLNERQAKRLARQTRRLSAISLQNGSFTSNCGLSSIPEDNVASLERLKEATHRPKYCGKVVCILERPRNMLFSGTLSLSRPYAPTLDNGSRDKKETHSPKIIWFIPADKRLPLVAVPIKHAPPDFIKYHEEYKNRIFIGSIQRWPATSLHPFGIVEQKIGWMGELGVHSRALMADHHIKDSDFTDSVKKAAVAVPAELTDEERKLRRDLTKEDLNIFTLGDQDHAFSITSTEKGMYEVGIHIADVSRYVHTNTPLDREARERSCAIELADAKRVPILPFDFLASHSSLQVGKERLAYSVMCRFTEAGVLLHAWIGHTVIKVKEDVGKTLTEEAKTLLSLCRTLQKIRLETLEGMHLTKPVLLFELADSGYPKQVHRYDPTDEEVLLQELLIIANMEVGQKISCRFPDQALLYRQDSPKLSKLSALIDHFECTPKDIHELIEWIQTKETNMARQQTMMHLVQAAMPPPKYFSAGSLDISKYHHFSFGTPICTVFTEPSQQYASIYVQRQLNAALKGEVQASDQVDPIDKIARHCNSSYLAKVAAEQDSKKLFVAAYIYRECSNTDSGKLSTEAFVISVEREMMTLYLPEFDLSLQVSNDFGYEHPLFLSRLFVHLHVDMRAIRPNFIVEF
ncbi:hypothetical protein A0J61_08000 [Choanephora cucurbitarum]|uniref:RNB domain-containing protein n=1 Tax=Choanephora cucurbitarum TaxID=101091 RepID=A0A1C7N5M9_9FUNG|nr:hypothetical protein A0J61_08000 [Choanephora cucurbitarum]